MQKNIFLPPYLPCFFFRPLQDKQTIFFRPFSMHYIDTLFPVEIDA